MIGTFALVRAFIVLFPFTLLLTSNSRSNPGELPSRDMGTLSFSGYAPGRSKCILTGVVAFNMTQFGFILLFDSVAPCSIQRQLGRPSWLSI
jgi:hypothetical protein